MLDVIRIDVASIVRDIFAWGVCNKPKMYVQKVGFDMPRNKVKYAEFALRLLI